MVRRLLVLVSFAVLLVTVRARAEGAKPLPDIDSWATFSFQEAFKREPPRNPKNAVAKDARQLFALICPDAKEDDNSIRDVEARVIALLNVQRLDWRKYVVFVYCAGYGRFREEARLDLRWLEPGKLEGRWTFRERGMGTCTVGALALVERTDAEIVFAKVRCLDR